LLNLIGYKNIIPHSTLSFQSGYPFTHFRQWVIHWVYRGRYKPRGISAYTLYIHVLSQLVAGPIESLRIWYTSLWKTHIRLWTGGEGLSSCFGFFHEAGNCWSIAIYVNAVYNNSASIVDKPAYCYKLLPFKSIVILQAIQILL